MTTTVYSLLVGIDHYPSPIPSLRGCVADIEAVHTFLQARISEQGSRYKPLILKNEQATRDAIIDGFSTHLGHAGANDVALFYYSGHGSQSHTPPEFWHLEPDRLDETLVCYDSRLPGHFDLVDKELSKLIAEIAKRNPQIVAIIDACHSGSATRNIQTAGVRRAPTDERQRPLSSYLISTTELETLDKPRTITGSTGGWIRLPKGRHIVLSACQSDEEAKEISFDGQTRGVFSYFLLKTLQSATNLWTYRDLFGRVNALVRAKVARQSPLIEATTFSDLDRSFLGGTIKAHTPHFVVYYDITAGWVIDGGAIHGIPSVTDNTETTHLAVFPTEATDMKTVTDAIGMAYVTNQQPSRCNVKIQLDDENQPDPDKTYKAIVTALPVPPLGVRFEGDETACQQVRRALNIYGPNGGPSLLVREVTDGEALVLLAHDNQYRVQRAGDDRPLAVVVEGWTTTTAQDIVDDLEHIARWMHMASLNNPISKLPPNAIRMDIYCIDANGEEEHVDVAKLGSDLRLHYQYYNNRWQQPTFKLKLTNTCDRRLYCMLFNLTDRYKIWAEGLLPGGGIWLKPGEEAWVYEGEAIPVSIPDELWHQGMSEYKDLLKIIASTESCDATRFQQDNLNVKYKIQPSRGDGTRNTLEQLMQRTQTRDIGDQRRQRIADWVTTEITITTIRPLEDAVLAASSGGSVALTPQLTIDSHSTLRAKVRLTTAPLASRDMTQAAPLPVWLRDSPSIVQPFNLSTSRDVEAGLNVLEFTDVSGYDTVMPAHPLVVQVGGTLTSDEHILPIAYDPDSRLYLPVGHAISSKHGITIKIERLPPPASSQRSLTGSIKIFFQKVIYETLGMKHQYPLLGTVDAEGNFITNLDTIRNRVTESERIILFIHGILGDTREMVNAAFDTVPGSSISPIANRYDMVLTFDYENLGTNIQSTARALEERLEQAGLTVGCDKTLHIVAHSMGGLVARWFIEHGKGRQTVQHLVMLGTPNAGSPWPTVEAWANTAIAFGLNSLSTVVWPAKMLGRFLSALERNLTVSLNQVEPESELLLSLAASDDPGVKYSIIAGNTSLLAAALRPSTEATASLVEQLLAKINLQHRLQMAVTQSLFGRPNDVAVAVDSIASVPKFANCEPTHQVACDHMTYFTTAASLQALSDTLAR